MLEAPIPNKSSTYSDDGTAMHHVAALCLTEHWRASKYVRDIPVNSRHEEPRFVEFTDEMAELVQGYVDTVRKIGIGHRMLVETRVDFSEFVQIEDQFGTADRIIVDLEQGELGVYDLKTGHAGDRARQHAGDVLRAGALRYLMDEDIATSAADPFDWAREQGLSTIRIGIYQPKVFARAGGLGVHDGGSAAVRHAGAQQGRERAQRRGDARQDPDGRVGSHLPEPEPERRRVRVLPRHAHLPERAAQGGRGGRRRLRRDHRRDDRAKDP